MLETIDLMMLKDSKDYSYIPFSNGVLKVTQTGTELKEYFEMDEYIWESQILERNWVKTKNLIPIVILENGGFLCNSDDLKNVKIRKNKKQA